MAIPAIYRSLVYDLSLALYKTLFQTFTAISIRVHVRTGTIHFQSSHRHFHLLLLFIPSSLLHPFVHLFPVRFILSTSTSSPSTLSSLIISVKSKAFRRALFSCLIDYVSAFAKKSWSENSFAAEIKSLQRNKPPGSKKQLSAQRKSCDIIGFVYFSYVQKGSNIFRDKYWW